MPLANIRYRVEQFLLAWKAEPDPDQLEKARQILGPSLWPVFAQMQPGEQAHSLSVMNKIIDQGCGAPELLQAALLHDAGKSRSPLSVWDRTWIVLARRLFPDRVRRWGQGEPTGWRRIFVVAEQHPAWGAEMAANAGADQKVIALIRQHQQTPSFTDPHMTDWLRILQEADDES